MYAHRVLSGLRPCGVWSLCGVFGLGPLGRLQHRKPKQAFSELDPVILTTPVRALVGRSPMQSVQAPSIGLSDMLQQTDCVRTLHLRGPRILMRVACGCASARTTGQAAQKP